MSVESSLVGSLPMSGVGRELHDPGIRDVFTDAMLRSALTKHMLTS